MGIHFKCPACGVAIRASDRKAGATSSCPKCGKVLSVPVQSPQPGEGDVQEASSEPPPEQPDAPSPAEPPEEEPLSAEPSPGGAGSTFPPIIVSSPRRSDMQPSRQPAARPALPKTVWLAAAAALAGVVLLGAGVLLGLYLSGDKKPAQPLLAEKQTPAEPSTEEPILDLSEETPESPPTETPEQPPTKKPTETPTEEPPEAAPEATPEKPAEAAPEAPPEAPSPPSPVLIVDWKEEDRDGAAVFIDDIENEVPESGPLEYKLPEGEHRVLLVRPGYKKMARTLVCESGKRYRLTAAWVEMDAPSADPGASPPDAVASQPTPQKPGDTAVAVAQPKDKAAAKTKPPKPPAKDKDVCKTCRGLGIVPLKPPKPYVHIEGDAAPKPQTAVCCRFCPDCQAKRDPKELVEHEIERLKTAGEKHREWESKTGWNLVRVETHYATIHAQLPPAEAVRIGMALEMMNAHLQQLTGSMALTAGRPDDYEIVIVFGKQNWLQLMKLMEPVAAKRSGKNWDLLLEAWGWTMDNTTYIQQSAQSTTPPAHIAVSQAAVRQIGLATAFTADDWLREGFSAYCESVVLKKNVALSTTHGQGDVRIGTNWPLEIQRYAAMGKLKPWKEVLHRDLEFFKPIDYLSAFAIVSYLIQTAPTKFVDFVDYLGQGLETEAALEKAYGKGIDELQVAWLRWLVRRR